MNLELVDEFRLQPSQRVAIGNLLQQAFPEYPRDRIYFKQLPPRRLLAKIGTQLVGHVALEHRVIGTDSGPLTIFGLIDVCVATSHCGQGIATKMLRHIERLAAEYNIDFLVLFATDARLYERNGFRRASNPLRWLKIHNHQSLGVAEQPLEELMVKSLSDKAWPAGTTDLLGYQF